MKDREEEIREQNILLKKSGKKQIVASQGIKQWAIKFAYLMTDGMIVYHFMFWAFSGLSIRWPPLMAFHMIDLSVRSEGVINVIKAVTTNGKALLLTAILLIILIYMYSVIGYFAIPDAYPDSNCETLYYCILYNINAGIRNGGGIGDVLTGIAPFDGRSYLGRFFLEISFFLIIIILGLNIVFGIILDTFGELRDKKSFIEEDMRSRCFICGIDSDTFQRQASGFKHHIKHDHNIWSYLYFFMYLDNKDQDEFTFIEEYIAEKRKAGENDYFPIGKAICLVTSKKKKGG
jgi:inositol 1,4,5-triphosphate receptor type 1